MPAKWLSHFILIELIIPIVGRAVKPVIMQWVSNFTAVHLLLKESGSVYGNSATLFTVPNNGNSKPTMPVCLRLCLHTLIINSD
jgi:hypothetical protein